MTCLFHCGACPLCPEGRESGGLGVLFVLLCIPSSVWMPVFYGVIALNKELEMRNNTLAKFPRCFTARVGATA